MKQDQRAQASSRRHLLAKELAPALASLPELEFLPTPCERERACATAAGQLGPAWVFGVLGSILAMAFGLSLGVALALVRHSLHWSPPGWVSNIAMVGGILATLGAARWLFARLHRGRAQRLLREYLVRQGIPVCVRCGYDLRGQTVARCPECGRRFSAALLKSRPTAPGTTSVNAEQ